MGITLMDTIDPFAYKNADYSDDDRQSRDKGFINTSRAYAPELLDIVTENASVRPIIIKEELAGQMSRGRHFHDEEAMYFYQIDRLNRHSREDLTLQENAACLGYFLEWVYKVPVQSEFVSDGQILHLVQTRILPEAHRQSASVEFPEEKPLLVRDATGVIDEEMEVLAQSKENSEKHGLVVFQKSYFTGDLQVDKYFPKSGAVMVLYPSKDIGGHIETLCVEKGLLCIFSSRSGPEEGVEHNDCDITYGRSAFNHFMGEERLPNIKGIGGHKRVRVVANGKEARIYAPKGNAEIEGNPS